MPHLQKGISILSLLFMQKSALFSIIYELFAQTRQNNKMGLTVWSIRPRSSSSCMKLFRQNCFLSVHIKRYIPNKNCLSVRTLRCFFVDYIMKICYGQLHSNIALYFPEMTIILILKFSDGFNNWLPLLAIRLGNCQDYLFRIKLNMSCMAGCNPWC